MGWQATRKAGLRRVGASYLEMCIADHTCYFKPNCFQHARDFCHDAGMETGCAFGEPEGMDCAR